MIWWLESLTKHPQQARAAGSALERSLTDTDRVETATLPLADMDAVSYFAKQSLLQQPKSVFPGPLASNEFDGLFGLCPIRVETTW